MISNNSPGFVIANTTIAVDHWPKKDNHHITHYFLTHCHTDHTLNLDETWKESHIFCSKVKPTSSIIYNFNNKKLTTRPYQKVSKKLLHAMNKVSGDLIVALETGKTHVLKLDKDELFNVTLIDANHCPGAVMFLFEG
jgi:DNA cross-link repair 1B protein